MRSVLVSVAVNGTPHGRLRRTWCVVAHTKGTVLLDSVIPRAGWDNARMPGTNLTRDEARTRAGLLEIESYTVDLDLDPSRTTTFGSTTVIRFRSRTAGASTFADLVGGTIHELTLNGRSLDPAEVYADHRIRLDGLEADNELRVVADCTYSHTGEGLHRFVDPADDRVYLYTQFEVPDARRVFTTFEQPDLKAVFHVPVTAPGALGGRVQRADPRARAAGRRQARRGASPTTERMSTYITAIVAGEYHSVHDTYVGKHGEIPLGHYCRQSMVAALRHRRARRGHQAGLRVLRGRLRLPLPVPQVRPALRPRVQQRARWRTPAA